MILSKIYHWRSRVVKLNDGACLFLDEQCCLSKILRGPNLGSNLQWIVVVFGKGC